MDSKKKVQPTHQTKRTAKGSQQAPKRLAVKSGVRAGNIMCTNENAGP